jgi:hypothetical protein
VLSLTLIHRASVTWFRDEPVATSRYARTLPTRGAWVEREKRRRAQAERSAAVEAVRSGLAVVAPR